MKLSHLALDVERQEKGAWADLPDFDGLSVLVRGAGNSDWRRLQTKLIEAVPRRRRAAGRLDLEESERIQCTLLLNTCLLDWKGLEDEEGNPIPYEKELARKLIFDPEYRRFREAVANAAGVVGDEIKDDQKETSGNSWQLSAGISSGEHKSNSG